MKKTNTPTKKKYKSIEDRARLKKAGYYKLYHAKERKEVLMHYSNGKMECKLCGIPDERLLLIDHENGGGSQDRKKIKTSNLYHYLKANTYPEGFVDSKGEFHKYRVLCHNCNFLERLRVLPQTQIQEERRLCSCGCGKHVDNPGCFYIFSHQKKIDALSSGQAMVKLLKGNLNEKTANHKM
jgi:hypothetical protein